MIDMPPEGYQPTEKQLEIEAMYAFVWERIFPVDAEIKRLDTFREDLHFHSPWTAEVEVLRPELETLDKKLDAARKAMFELYHAGTAVERSANAYVGYWIGFRRGKDKEQS